MSYCLICNLNTTKEFTIEATNYWQIDKPKDILLDGLYFVKTKRHIESLAEMDESEQEELGSVLQKYCSESKLITTTDRIITLNLGLKEPHLHFWVIPITQATEPFIKNIGKEVKEFADYFRR